MGDRPYEKNYMDQQHRQGGGAGNPRSSQGGEGGRGYAPRRAVVLGGLGGKVNRHLKPKKRTAPAADFDVMSLFKENSREGGYAPRESRDSRESAPRGRSERPVRSAGPSRGRSEGPRRTFGASAGGRGESRFSGSRMGSGGPSKRAERKVFSDISKFVNRAAVTEVVPQFVPEHRFEDFAFGPKLAANIAARGYVTPSPIQDKAIPHALRGEDLVGLAETGTGKTAAFLLPLMERALARRDDRVLIVTPTRELAVQIADEFNSFGKGLMLGITVLIGGVGMEGQRMALRRNPRFVVATPGRLIDLASQRAVDIASFNVLVLDEADRMFDMGFQKDLQKIITGMPRRSHTLCFSATMPKEIEHLVAKVLNNPAVISVKKRDTSKNVDQDVIRVRGRDEKFEKLCELLKKPEFNKVLIFARTKHGTERLGRVLSHEGFAAESIHGDKSQNQRQRALDRFKRDAAQVLVATDVAARGLDISGVSHVINFDLPSSYEDYIHRIGRTGRAGLSGVAITFIEEGIG